MTEIPFLFFKNVLHFFNRVQRGGMISNCEQTFIPMITIVLVFLVIQEKKNVELAYPVQHFAFEYIHIRDVVYAGERFTILQD